MASNSGSPVRQRPPKEFQRIIQNKLGEILGSSGVDDVLPEYVMVMICNKKSKDQVGKELGAFLGDRSSAFVDWLWTILKSSSFNAGVSAAFAVPNSIKPASITNFPDATQAATKPASVIDVQSERDQQHARHSSSHRSPGRRDHQSSRSDSRHEKRGRSRENTREHRDSAPNDRSQERRHHESRSRGDHSQQRQHQQLQPVTEPVAEERAITPLSDLLDDAMEATASEPQQSGAPLKLESEVFRPQQLPPPVLTHNPRLAQMLTHATSDAARSVRETAAAEQIPAPAQQQQQQQKQQPRHMRLSARSTGRRARSPRRRQPMLHQPTNFTVVLDVPPPRIKERLDDKWLADVDPSAKRHRPTIRCTQWPACPRGDDCAFLHPSELCTNFPQCPYGDTCHYVHPVVACKFGTGCTRAGCAFQHPSRADVPCRYSANCSNEACGFQHPKGRGIPCRFGEQCTNRKCEYQHAG
eukprot:TRINITY_DN11754_c0_g1_i1.p1 TRINITY_DN11754_c0_g1~~TRINITY_DN11754_c0_g1_i1.p1  ORF type:complete len:470 (+),score=48.79 TRINITY_DN11754_c0_g1_i1:72-1481(+)